ncbi:MAG: hypothetical protein JWP18_1204, partial [Solirubrobacterales bacterium]|nr:hypothetical protein [Solirubrobacterales bacterium]
RANRDRSAIPPPETHGRARRRTWVAETATTVRRSLPRHTQRQDDARPPVDDAGRSNPRPGTPGFASAAHRRRPRWPITPTQEVDERFRPAFRVTPTLRPSARRRDAPARGAGAGLGRETAGIDGGGERPGRIPRRRAAAGVARGSRKPRPECDTATPSARSSDGVARGSRKPRPRCDAPSRDTRSRTTHVRRPSTPTFRRHIPAALTRASAGRRLPGYVAAEDRRATPCLRQTVAGSSKWPYFSSAAARRVGTCSVGTSRGSYCFRMPRATDMRCTSSGPS